MELKNPDSDSSSFDSEGEQTLSIREQLSRLRRAAEQRRHQLKEFASVEHLNPEAVAALVDNELSASAEHRAKIHLVQCEECRAEVNRQRNAAQRVRAANSGEFHAPKELLAKLASIETSCEEEPAGQASIGEKFKSLAQNAASLQRKIRSKKNKRS